MWNLFEDTSPNQPGEKCRTGRQFGGSNFCTLLHCEFLRLYTTVTMDSHLIKGLTAHTVSLVTLVWQRIRQNRVGVTLPNDNYCPKLHLSEIEVHTAYGNRNLWWRQGEELKSFKLLNISKTLGHIISALHTPTLTRLNMDDWIGRLMGRLGKRTL